MRVFIAIDIEPGVLKAIGSLQRELGRDMPSAKGVNWVDPGIIHLTLKFLGDIDEESVGRVSRVVAKAAERQAGFTINISGLGVFGRPARHAPVATRARPISAATRRSGSGPAGTERRHWLLPH